MVLLDTEKAYDTVWLNGLLYKLISLQLLDSFLPWVLLGRSYLYCSPEWLYLHPETYPLQSSSGYRTNDYIILPFSDKPCPPYTHLTLYADDTAPLSQSWQPDTICRRLTVMTLLKYFNLWKLWLDTHKTKTILFSKCHPPSPSWTLFKSRHFVPWASTVRYLDLVTDS